MNVVVKTCFCVSKVAATQECYWGMGEIHFEEVNLVAQDCCFERLSLFCNPF